MKLLINSASLFTAIFLLAGCGGSSDYDFTTPIEVPASAPTHGPIFDPAAGKLPTTNDLFFVNLADGSVSADGTLQIPNTSENPIIPQINTLDGFSTSNPIIAEFGTPIDQASLAIGSSVRVFEVSKTQGAVTGVVREITAAEMSAVAIGDGTSLALVPHAPLKESTSYMVLLTNLIKGTDGLPAQSASTYVIAKSQVPLTGGDFAALEPIRMLVNNMEDVAVSQSIAKESIVLSWSFTTQSITPVLKDVAASAKAGNLIVAATGKTTNDVSSSLPGIADVYIGTLDVPYYLETPTEANSFDPRSGYWKGVNGSSLTRYNTTPVANTNLTIPVMMTVPNAMSGQTKPATGWPVVMYQHGITRNRTDVIVYADRMAQAGFAVIALDLPMHGAAKTLTVGDQEVPNPFHADSTPFAETELSFDLDLMDNATGAPTPDDKIDDSGAHFINLTNLLNSRDNVRQGVSDLLTLRKSLASAIDAGTGMAFGLDGSKVGFIAHSLGGMVAVPYMGVETQSMPTSLVSAGAPISKVLQDSASFGPRILAGLEAAGVTGDAVPAYFQAAQFIVDSADPVNFAAAAVALHSIHMIEVADDQTVPNSSTEILAALLGTKSVSQTVTDIAPGPNSPGIVRFTEGAHSSPLDPSQGLNVFLEMHSQMVNFQVSGGTDIVIDNSDGIIQQ